MLSLEDEKFLTELHRNFELRDLDPADRRYVHLEQYGAAVGQDAVKHLTRAITRTARGSVFFSFGFARVGKEYTTGEFGPYGSAGGVSSAAPLFGERAA
jgi:hypothetical protein